ncbi:Ina17p TDEL_0A05230 [Torulaspora delbrueckii]|uniref:Inner membrane assembly complex subunit 17 n=1 Tax=Torulaspora delbrueckii TaxID=4950 RepID=G8ZML1_TORDE|nr:hypothetical protein TDEL_0A05230 [Torulaspora delbrueckii]CCE89855.1 hypothetical protein TDEL_0A05230 [Torulaspora delbrueckii]
MSALTALKTILNRQTLHNPLILRATQRIVIRSIANDANRQEIRTLEDLSKLKSLNDVDPELIKKLINERTSELNTKNELDMLKGFEEEEKKLRQSPLKRFTRPLWIFLLMSSTVYLICHYVWWRLEYEEKEIAYSHRVGELEAELRDLLAHKSEGEDTILRENTRNRPWYKRWFF